MAVSTPPVAYGRPEAWTADEALERLYAAHRRALVRLAVLLLHDRELAEEVVQDSFVAVHRHWSSLRDPDLGLAYLRRTVVNRARSVQRRRTVEQRHLRTVVPGADLPGVDDALAVTERRQRVLAALQQLPRRQREVLVLRHYADLDEAGVAAALGISRGAVKSHAHRAAARLRELLQEER
jgi:RNA polymerase sigma-70 factor (sigma-E family)